MMYADSEFSPEEATYIWFYFKNSVVILCKKLMSVLKKLQETVFIKFKNMNSSRVFLFY